MKHKLKTKLTAAFFFMAALLFLFISVVANYTLQSRFQKYTISKLEAENRSIVSQLPARYSTEKKAWDVSGVESVGLSAMERGLIIKVLDGNGAIVWDARVYNNGYCSQMMTNMEVNMRSQMPGFKGGYVENSHDLLNGTEKVGTVLIGYYGPYYYSDKDMQFIMTLNQVLLAAGGLALVLSLIFGAYLSKRLSDPMNEVVAKAKSIADGAYGTKIGTRSNTVEIQDLTSSINSLGENLEKQEELRKRLSADIAHELRTPLTTLQSHLELMIEGIWEADSERLKGLQEETVRLGKLVGDLGKIAQLESQNMVLRAKWVDLSEIGEDVAKTMEGEFLKKGIQLSYAGEKSEFQGDEDKLRQILMNLISNALCYTPSGGLVQVRIQRSERTCILSVQDNGIGISEDDQPHIFERFYRADSSRARNSGGAGIGLAITKALVEAHGGRISLESSLGKGSCFTVEFPAERVWPLTGK